MKHYTIIPLLLTLLICAAASTEARMGVFAAWWSQNNTVAFAAQYALLLDAAQRGRSGVQMVTNGTSDSAGFGPGGLAAALDLAESQGIRYFEVWNADILNPNFDALLRSHTLRTSVEFPAVSKPQVFTAQFYPQPATRDAVLRIDADEACTVRGTIVSILGRVVSEFDGIAIPAGGGILAVRAVLGAKQMPLPGMYIIRLDAGQRTVSLKWIVR